MKYLSSPVFLPLPFVLFAGAAFAQEPAPGTIQVGAVYSISNDPYVGDGGLAFPIPNIEYIGDGFTIGVRGATVDLLTEENLTVKAVLQPRLTGLEFQDEDELDGIDRNLTLDLGVTGEYTYGMTFLKATALQEVTREHDGQELSFEIGQRLRAGPVILEVSGGGIFRSADLNDHLYGVRDNEVRPGRPSYSPDADLTPFVSAGVILPLSDRARAFSRVRYEVLSEAATDSPIIEEDERVEIAFGVGYSF